MNILISALYNVILGVIQVWLLMKYAVVFIGFKPIKAYVQRRMNEMGIGTVGNEPSNIVVHNDWFYHRLACDGTLGLGETYINGWWDCKKLDAFFCQAVRAGICEELLYPWDRFMHYLQFDFFNIQTVARAGEVAKKHYDLGNYLFESFLDKSMNYSCAYWKDAKNLEEAQQHKMELIGRKLKLKPGMRVLDWGCGCGALCKFLAETYKVHVVGITNSKEGTAEAKERCKGLSVEIRCQDYRYVNEVFDRIVSVGFFEHIGHKNHRPFFELAHRCLSDDGILLIQTVGHDNDSVPRRDLFQHKYIFPNGILPNHKEIPKAIDNIFCIEDWHNFGQYYELTLLAWYDNFVKNWHTICHKFENPDTFYRMWTYYLLLAAGLFRARKLHLWQIVLTKPLQGGYISVR